jgi:hypothetical protein
MPRPRRVVVEPPRPPEGAIRLPEQIRSKPLLTPSEVGEILGISAKEVLVLPGLPRISLSEQRIRYNPEHLEDFLNSRRVMQGFAATALGAFLTAQRRPLSATAVAEVFRVRREVVRAMLGAAPYPSEHVLTFIEHSRSIQPA